MKLVRPDSLYTIEDVPVLGTFRVSQSSSEYLNRPDGLKYVLDRGLRLQSLGEAVAARVALSAAHAKDGQGLDDSNLYQVVSTLALHFLHGKKGIVTGFSEVPTDEEGLALMREGYDAHCAGQELIKPVNGLVARLVTSALESKRVVPALVESPLKLSTAQRRGRSEYGKNSYTVAAFGNEELAELNATYLQGNGFGTGYFWDFPVDRLASFLKGDERKVHVRPVCFGGIDYNNIYYVNANGNFVSSGRVRGVSPSAAKKISICRNNAD